MLDVARRAGVSHQTVSRVLNQHPHVREATRAKVRRAIEQLGYRPNGAARALARGRYQTIGVVAPRSTLFGPVSLLAAFEEQAADSGFSVSVGRVRRLDEDSIGEAVERHLDQGVAGIVVIAPVESAVPALAQLPAHLPAISVDGVPTGGVTSVSIDQAEGARIATRHLLEAGHATVWHVTGPADWFDAAGRVRGWLDALREAGASVPPTIPGDWSAASGYRAGQLLGRMPEVTAVFTANDAQAIGLLRALHELGKVVPRDVSVVGFDDVPDAEYLIPPLTTVRQDFDAVARRALEVLLDQIESVRRGSRADRDGSADGRRADESNRPADEPPRLAGQPIGAAGPTQPAEAPHGPVDEPLRSAGEPTQPAGARGGSTGAASALGVAVAVRPVLVSRASVAPPPG